MVKESYFPNWEVDGADGPWRATPNFMVVVPTARHVVLHFGTTTAEWLGRSATVVGFVALAVVGYIAAGLTAFYAFRMVFRVFFRSPVPEARDLERVERRRGRRRLQPERGEHRLRQQLRVGDGREVDEARAALEPAQCDLEREPLRLACIVLIVAGIAGLKLTSS